MIARPTRPVTRRLLRVAALAGALLGAGWLSGLKLMAFPGESMTPAVGPGDHFVAFTRLWNLRSPRRFDLVIYDVPPGSKWAERKIPWMKRLIGLPEEHIRVSGSDLIVNGRKVDAPFLRPAAGRQEFEVTLGPNQFFMLGDNLDHSFDDSRSMGPIDRSLLRGRVAFVIRTSPTKNE